MFKTSEVEAAAEDRGQGSAARWLITAGSGDPAGGVVGVADLAPGSELPVHRHPNADEAIVVLAGEGVLSVGGGELPAPAGTVLYAPRGSWHSVRAVSAPVKLLIVYGGAPSVEAAGFEERTDADDRSGPTAQVVRIEDVPLEEFDVPEQGFHKIGARWLVDERSMASTCLVLGQSTFAPDGGAHELHRHPGAEEFMFILEGEGVHIAEDGTEVPLRPGDATLMSRDEWHGYRTREGVRTTTYFGYLGASSLEDGGYELPDRAP